MTEKITAVPLTADQNRVIQYINLKLGALGQPPYGGVSGDLLEVAWPLLQSMREKNKFTVPPLCPADARVQGFLDAYFKEDPVVSPVALPVGTFVLDRPGLARVLSLPPDQDCFSSDIVTTYRVAQGVLHNPKNDRRTTKGVFHVAEGGLPIPWDKKAVPKGVFRNLLNEALRPPENHLGLPFTCSQFEKAHVWVSLLMRPLVCPAVPGRRTEKTMEIRFFAPGALVGNLDFVEAIFGNGGDPFLSQNDASLDPEGWTGHTGCVILAPHLTGLLKKDLGLPPVAEATERQKRDGMCYSDPQERYNEGEAFKVCARDERGVMVTVIADNYFGYCKKEIKTQISYSANLYGWAEEEHAGGALAFASYDLGGRFEQEEKAIPQNGLTFADVSAMYGAMMDVKPEGYAVDHRFPEILYVPENTRFDLTEKKVSWVWNGVPHSLKLLADRVYVYPNGYKVTLVKQADGQGWHLAGTLAEGTLCHKPSTVSGGGKSEISKSIEDAMVQGPVFVADLKKDMDEAEKILQRDFGERFLERRPKTRPSRSILSAARSLGSVIKLLTPSVEYTEEFNAWLLSIPPHIMDLVLVLKRFYEPDWGDNWRDHLSVDMINGAPGHELKLDGHRLRASYLRVGYEATGARRIYRVRQDFDMVEKIQMEDDITASVVVPREAVEGLPFICPNPSVKFVANCETLLFQRPDDAVHPGWDRQAEADIAGQDVFLSNWEPLRRSDVKALVEDAITFSEFTDPVRTLAKDFLRKDHPTFMVSSAHPRLVGGKPTKNQRYLQERPDRVNARATWAAEMGTRLFRKILPGRPVPIAVGAVLPARRNNPPDAKIGAPPLCVYNPIHYQELPELFMDFICSLTGKSPSTTGFGSEGALTKLPFNALPPIVDLNNALVSYILTGYHGFTTAAGYVGPRIRVEHDISLLVPEIWARMSIEERDPLFLIREGYLEKMKDFTHRGELVPASRLGYRITSKFVRGFLGRIFNNPNVVLTEDILQPELQDPEVFADGVVAIVSAHKRVAEDYFSDGSVAWACPPLRALLHIMARGSYEGMDLNHPKIRTLFTRENMLAGDWYKERLVKQRDREISLWKRHTERLTEAVQSLGPTESARLSLHERLSRAKAQLKEVESPHYLATLTGYLGADPFGRAG